MTSELEANPKNSSWDHTTHADFFDYYVRESESEATAQRFQSVQTLMLRIAAQMDLPAQLDVADIGCGAGTQARVWAERGHRVYAIDVNEPLIQLARERAERQGAAIRFEVGTATALPWDDRTMDVCLLPQLLEHVADWQCCLNEAARVLRPGGLLYLSTTNVLCPRQEEFNLPLYSWYPRPLKRYCECVAVTTRPAIANYAKYPAVNWFSFYGLRNFLTPLGFRCLDRFDLIDPTGKGAFAKMVLAVVRWAPLLRFLGHVATEDTTVVAVKSLAPTPGVSG